MPHSEAKRTRLEFLLSADSEVLSREGLIPGTTPANTSSTLGDAMNEAIPNRYERHSDPPLAEAVLILHGVRGLCLRLKDDNPRLFRNVCLIAGVLAIIAYGSWWWTEVMYDQQVIHSFPTYLHQLNSE